MNIETHLVKDIKIAEIHSAGIIINSVDDGLNLLGNLYYQDFEKVILHENNITPDFFNLENGMAGEILQKFSNYKVRLAIVGDFSKYTNKSINAFMYESNKVRQINFVNSATEAIEVLSNA
jgi:hypothetical protein